LQVDKQESESVTSILAGKLDGLAKLLDLDPYCRQGTFERKLRSINEDDIASIHIVCPISMEYETATCQSHAIHKYTWERDIFYVSLIRRVGQCNQALVVADQCPKCKTIYHADHEYSVYEGKELKLY